MHVRLAFSTSIQVDADILLIDEVLAVGDASFQQKCFDVFNDLRDRGKTIVFVTHDMGSLRRFCHRAMLLEHGDMVYLGDPEMSATATWSSTSAATREAAADRRRRHAGGDGEARVTEVWIEDEAGERRPAVPQHQRSPCMRSVRVHGRRLRPAASVYIHNEEHKAIIVGQTVRDHERTGHSAAGEEAVFSFAFENVLAPGRYSPVVMLAHRGAGLDVIDRFEGEFSFVVTGTGRARRPR